MSGITDKSIMPWGKYKGYTMENIPASYLIWLYDENKCSGGIRAYIIDNLEVLKLEAKQ